MIGQNQVDGNTNSWVSSVCSIFEVLQEQLSRACDTERWILEGQNIKEFLAASDARQEECYGETESNPVREQHDLPAGVVVTSSSHWA